MRQVGFELIVEFDTCDLPEEESIHLIRKVKGFKEGVLPPHIHRYTCGLATITHSERKHSWRIDHEVDGQSYVVEPDLVTGEFHLSVDGAVALSGRYPGDLHFHDLLAAYGRACHAGKFHVVRPHQFYLIVVLIVAAIVSDPHGVAGFYPDRGREITIDVLGTEVILDSYI